jgi:hypothetical protein
MKFYRYVNSFNYWDKIKINNLTAIYKACDCIAFYKNGKFNNSKNASYIGPFPTGRKEFCLNGTIYGNQKDFTKQFWRKFVKHQVFK